MSGSSFRTLFTLVLTARFSLRAAIGFTYQVE